jgi:hypothetical protein
MINLWDKYDDRERYPEGPPDGYETYPQQPLSPEDKKRLETFRKEQRNQPASDEEGWYTGGGW